MATGTLKGHFKGRREGERGKWWFMLAFPFILIATFHLPFVITVKHLLPNRNRQLLSVLDVL